MVVMVALHEPSAINYSSLFFRHDPGG